MVFLRASAYLDPPPLIRGRGVYLRQPALTDFAAWSSLRAESRGFLEPWEPLWPADDLTRGAFRYRIRRHLRDSRADTAYAFFAFDEDTDELLGGLTLSNVRRGVAQSASLGYWIGARHARKGYMTAAVRALLPYAFDILKLHRVEAACIPTNRPSMALLKRCGFSEEGLARRYLRIAGIWQDHLLFAILENDPRP
ncbi:MAG: GNAT family protein [Hyphomicrobiales bacterium]